MQRRIDDTARIVQIVLEGISREVTTALADMQDVVRNYPNSQVTQLLIQERAKYGTKLITNLALQLTLEFG